MTHELLKFKKMNIIFIYYTFLHSKNIIILIMNSNEQIANDVTMYIIINADLKMNKGKIASQVGHVVGIVVEEIIVTNYDRKTADNTHDYILYDKWKNECGHKKIVLKATTKELLKLIEDNKKCRYVIDCGLTQIAQTSLTVVGFFPIHNMADKMKNFKLL